MALQLAPSKDLSLQHLLENGLALVRNQELENGRRGQVLDNLIEIFSQADLGSQALGAQNLLFATEQRPAFERFSLFFRYLHDSFGNELSNRLREATGVLNELRDNKSPANTSRQRAEELLNAFITALERERTLSPLIPPKVYHLG